MMRTSSVDEACSESLFKDEMNPACWFPPEECIPLSVLGESDDGCSVLKEEKLTAIKNGKFRTLITQLVESAGVGSSSDSWVDIVTALSWEAAAVKLDPKDGKAMDPNEFVKIKCIATESCIQSKLIEGLVFGRHSAYKQMPVEYRNPTVLLIHGSLDHSSSSESMTPVEKEALIYVNEMIDKYCPNVILVKKSVSQDIQEALLEKGIVSVSDMKLDRLERVARCFGSPFSSSDVCVPFCIEKYIEDHAISIEDGKQSSNRLMFLEGGSTSLGCTILLKGANNNELKRIKPVVQHAVFMAYHLMLETCFILYQSRGFSTFR